VQGSEVALSQCFLGRHTDLASQPFLPLSPFLGTHQCARYRGMASQAHVHVNWGETISLAGLSEQVCFHWSCIAPGQRELERDPVPQEAFLLAGWCILGTYYNGSRPAPLNGLPTDFGCIVHN
jgi:hypothetical protein